MFIIVFSILILKGSGKTFLINTLKTRLLKANKKPALMATTGMAALLIGGTTLHRFLGVTDFSRQTEELVELALQDSYTKNRIK